MTQHYIKDGRILQHLNNVYEHSYLHFKSLILFMPTSS